MSFKRVVSSSDVWRSCSAQEKETLRQLQERTEAPPAKTYVFTFTDQGLQPSGTRKRKDFNANRDPPAPETVKRVKKVSFAPSAMEVEAPAEVEKIQKQVIPYIYLRQQLAWVEKHPPLGSIKRKWAIHVSHCEGSILQAMCAHDHPLWDDLINQRDDAVRSFITQLVIDSHQESVAKMSGAYT